MLGTHWDDEKVKALNLSPKNINNNKSNKYMIPLALTIRPELKDFLSQEKKTISGEAIDKNMVDLMDLSKDEFMEVTGQQKRLVTKAEFEKSLNPRTHPPSSLSK